MNTFKPTMHNIPVEVHSAICRALDVIDKEHVHIAHESLIKDDNNFYCVIACEQEVEEDNFCNYSVFNYSVEENKLYRCRDNLPYYDALIEMAARIKE